jgi:predicted transposase YdaD
MDHYASLKAAEKYGREEERAENARKLKIAMMILLKQGVSVENIALSYQMTSEEVNRFLENKM